MRWKSGHVYLFSLFKVYSTFACFIIIKIWMCQSMWSLNILSSPNPLGICTFEDCSFKFLSSGANTVFSANPLNNSLYDQSILLLPLSFLLVRIIVWCENCLSKPFAHQSRLFTFKLLWPLKHVYYTGKTCHYQFKCPIPNAHGLLEGCRGCWSFKLIGMLFKMKSLNL